MSDSVCCSLKDNMDWGQIGLDNGVWIQLLRSHTVEKQAASYVLPFSLPLKLQIAENWCFHFVLCCLGWRQPVTFWAQSRLSFLGNTFNHNGQWLFRWFKTMVSSIRRSPYFLNSRLSGVPGSGIWNQPFWTGRSPFWEPSTDAWWYWPLRLTRFSNLNECSLLVEKKKCWMLKYTWCGW